MQKLVFDLRDQLAEFIEQRKDLILLLKGDQAGVSISVNALRELEQTPGTDLFLIVSGAFGKADSIADAIVGQVRAERENTCQALLEDERELLPPLPTLLDEDSGESETDPVRRIQLAIQYAGSLLDPNGNHRLVVGLFPTGIGLPDHYHDLIRQLAPTSGLQPWMRGVRLICCDHSNSPVDTLTNLPRLRMASYDLSHEAIQSALYHDVQNDALTDSHRVNAVYQLAIFDHAYDRTDDALEKYDYLLGFFQGTENEVMQAMVMHSTGEVYRKTKQLSEARHWYHCATVPAINAKSRQALQMILRSLGELERECGNEKMAQVYCSQMHKLSNANGDVLGVLNSERQQALGYERVGRMDQAAATLEQSAHRCRSLGLDFELEQTLTQLLPVYESLEINSRKHSVEQELQQLRVAGGEA